MGKRTVIVGAVIVGKRPVIVGKRPVIVGNCNWGNVH